jgi:hypothetical protein
MRVEFRDGEREIPDHLAAMMQGLETYKMTFDEAVDAANKKLTKDRVNKVMNQIRDQHFRGMRQ